MKIIVITGGIGSGKSAVSAILMQKGIPVYDSDSRVKALYEIHPELKSMLCRDIFNQPERLKALEDAVYPVMMEDFTAWTEQQNSSWVALESAVILQKSFFDGFGDVVLLVDAPVELRVERALKRGNVGRDSLLRRIELQRNERDNNRVGYIIDNDSDIEELRIKVDEFLNTIEYGKGKN